MGKIIKTAFAILTLQLDDIEPHSEFNSSDIYPVCPGSADIHSCLIYI